MTRKTIMAVSVLAVLLSARIEKLAQRQSASLDPCCQFIGRRLVQHDVALLYLDALFTKPFGCLVARPASGIVKKLVFHSISVFGFRLDKFRTICTFSHKKSGESPKNSARFVLLHFMLSLYKFSSHYLIILSNVLFRETISR